jgi:hypothetical protein
LCGRTLSHYSLVRCFRCRKVYCRNCAAFTWFRNVLRYVPICLNCARRFVSPSKRGTRTSKYGPLRNYLARRPPSTNYVTLTFSEIEKIIEDRLPFSAVQHQHWWSNSDNSSQARSWLYAGWKVYDISLNKASVVFQRTRTKEPVTAARRKRRSRSSTSKAFQPPTPRAPRRRIPSQTRIAMTVARLRNVEQRRASIRRYRGKFKPRSAFEKRLYRPEAKPSKLDDT